MSPQQTQMEQAHCGQIYTKLVCTFKFWNANNIILLTNGAHLPCCAEIMQVMSFPQRNPWHWRSASRWPGEMIFPNLKFIRREQEDFRSCMMTVHSCSESQTHSLASCLQSKIFFWFCCQWFSTRFAHVLAMFLKTLEPSTRQLLKPCEHTPGRVSEDICDCWNHRAQYLDVYRDIHSSHDKEKNMSKYSSVV